LYAGSFNETPECFDRFITFINMAETSFDGFSKERQLYLRGNVKYFFIGFGTIWTWKKFKTLLEIPIKSVDDWENRKIIINLHLKFLSNVYLSPFLNLVLQTSISGWISF
jgi:hypothetical protein